MAPVRNWLLATFPSLKPVVGAALAQHARIRKLTRGDVLLREREVPEHAVVLVSGRLLLSSEVPTRVLLDSVAPFQPVGLAQALTGQPMFATLEARRATTVILLPAGALRETAEQHPELTFDAIQRTGELMARLVCHIADAMSAEASDRILARLRSDANLAAASHQELADALGLRRETVSRVVADLVARGVLERFGSRLVIREVPMDLSA